MFATRQNAKWSSKQKEMDALKAKNASLREREVAHKEREKELREKLEGVGQLLIDGNNKLKSSVKTIDRAGTGADPGFFLGGDVLVSRSTSTPINHIVFFCGIPVVLENRRSSREGGVRTPCTLPLDPPLWHKQSRGKDRNCYRVITEA